MNQGVAGVDPERDNGCVTPGGDLRQTDQKSRLTFASLTSFANRSVSAAINCFI